MVRWRILAAAITAIAATLVPHAALARKPLSAAPLVHVLRAPAVPVPPARLLLVSPAIVGPAHHAGSGACGICGVGVPDARLSRDLLLGADSIHDRLRVYVKKVAPRTGEGRETQWMIDLGTNSALLGYGFRF